MIGILLYFIIVTLWTSYEIYQAPIIDEDGRIIKPGKKLSDLYRKK
jgi:hypothetical protein